MAEREAMGLVIARLEGFSRASSGLVRLYHAGPFALGVWATEIGFVDVRGSGYGHGDKAF